jgi:hypothetical protein
LLFVFSMMAALTGVKWNLNVVFICILFANLAEHFFIYLLVICTSSVNNLFNSFVHLLIELFVLWMGCLII